METLFFLLPGVLLALAAVQLRRRYASFPGQSPTNYQQGFPVLDVPTHLNGRMICEGVIFGPLGRVTSSFVADFDICWNGGRGVMDEVFRYDDGSVQIRQWQLTLLEGGAFEMRADDVPGLGRGQQGGNAVQMIYPIRLPEKSGGHVLSCVDWMYLTPDGTVMNRSQFRKFGIKVAELIATIRPVSAP